MNRMDPSLFSAVFTAWVRETWPDRHNLVAIDGKADEKKDHLGKASWAGDDRRSRSGSNACCG